tara:strand:+ start:60 stop:398 length:339 start_codon:yes stop_codon:yes gene_type:complete
MRYVKLPNSEASKLTVTAVATDLYSLIVAAAGNVDFTDFDELRFRANGIAIQVEGLADVRFLADGNEPTADIGIKIGTGYFETYSGLNPWGMKLISTGADTEVNIQIFITKQ